MTVVGRADGTSRQLEKPLEIKACEFEGLSEPLLLGLEDLASTGLELRGKDQGGNPLFYLPSLGMEVTGIGKSNRSPPSYMLRPTEPVDVPPGKVVKIPVELVRSSRTADPDRLGDDD